MTMARHKVVSSAALLLLTAMSSGVSAQMCDSREYQMCISMADPLIRNPKLVFPDTMTDIDEVCRTWGRFVDCVKNYTERCFSPTRRLQFNQAIQRSVDSVHQMCTQTPYQTEYLSHASCIKMTLNNDCNVQYRLLADLVANASPMTSREDICCAHHKFRECIIRETKQRCDAGRAGPASRFAQHILDKALSFLHEDCGNYIPQSGDCAGNSFQGQMMKEDAPATTKYPTPRGFVAFNDNRRNYRFWSDTGSRHTFGRSTKTEESTSATTKRYDEFFMPEDKISSSDAPWMPPANNPENIWTPGNVENNQLNIVAAAAATERPYFVPSSNAPWPAAQPETSTRISWGMEENENYVHSTESWYPEANNHHNGVIDEPNQQGLHKGAASGLHKQSLGVILLAAAPLFLRQLLS
ncbi:uncharacterized protein LOC135946515 isoform X2 [Cloeon dipterum]|uniref:uncharacterized protein LOC135946515 isoform X2 n=1 Tax=Cloeon dipterum TaxID=197152 RepID=UPI00321F6C66